MFLKEDIISTYNGKVYGRKGDCVNFLEDHGNVFLVVSEVDENGFAVNIDLLTDDQTKHSDFKPAEIQVSKELTIEEDPVQLPPVKKKKAGPVKSKPNNELSLF